MRNSRTSFSSKKGNTLSFLVTTPEAWVSGGTVHGFPSLALPGLLVVKDFIMLGAAILTMADSAKAYLR
jgi:reactive chlorine resistance protein C